MCFTYARYCHIANDKLIITQFDISSLLDTCFGCVISKFFIFLHNEVASNRGCVTTQRSHTQELIVGT